MVEYKSYSCSESVSLYILPTPQKSPLRNKGEYVLLSSWDSSLWWQLTCFPPKVLAVLVSIIIPQMTWKHFPKFYHSCRAAIDCHYSLLMTLLKQRIYYRAGCSALCLTPAEHREIVAVSNSNTFLSMHQEFTWKFFFFNTDSVPLLDPFEILFIWYLHLFFLNSALTELFQYYTYVIYCI